MMLLNSPFYYTGQLYRNVGIMDVSIDRGAAFHIRHTFLHWVEPPAARHVDVAGYNYSFAYDEVGLQGQLTYSSTPLGLLPIADENFRPIHRSRMFEDFGFVTRTYADYLCRIYKERKLIAFGVIDG